MKKKEKKGKKNMNRMIMWCLFSMGLMVVGVYNSYGQGDLEVYLLTDADSKMYLSLDETSYSDEDSFAFITDQVSLDSFVVHSITPLSGAAAVAGLSSAGAFSSLGKAFDARAGLVLLTLAGGAVVAGYLVKGLRSSEGLSSTVLFSALSPKGGGLESQVTGDYEGSYGSGGGGGTDPNAGWLARVAAFFAAIQKWFSPSSSSEPSKALWNLRLRQVLQGNKVLNADELPQALASLQAQRPVDQVNQVDGVELEVLELRAKALQNTTIDHVDLALVKAWALKKVSVVLPDKEAFLEDWYLLDLVNTYKEVSLFELEEDTFYFGGTTAFDEKVAELAEKHGYVNWFEGYIEDKAQNDQEGGVKLFRFQNIYYLQSSESFWLALQNMLDLRDGVKNTFARSKLFRKWKDSLKNTVVTLVGGSMGGSEYLNSDAEKVPLSYFVSSQEELPKSAYFEMEEGVLYEVKTRAFMEKFLELEKTNPDLHWLSFKGLPMDGTIGTHMTFFLEGSKLIKDLSSNPLSEDILLSVGIEDLKASGLWVVDHPEETNSDAEHSSVLGDMTRLD